MALREAGFSMVHCGICPPHDWYSCVQHPYIGAWVATDDFSPGQIWRSDDRNVGFSNFGPDFRSIILVPTLGCHIRIDAERDAMVDRADIFDRHAIFCENRFDHLEQFVGVRNFG